ncbi:MAG: PAS domain-containing sensor histidine kinase, partial [Proteobacteria bacterium]
DQGEFQGVFCICNETTRKVVAERELKSAYHQVDSAREQLHQFFMQNPVPMVILMGPEFRFALANRPYEQFIGRSVQGKTVREVFNAEEVAGYLPILEKVFHTGEPYIGRELPFDLIGPDQQVTRKWIDLIYQPYREDSGEIKGLLALVHDVTASVEARDLIAASEKQFRQISNTLSLIIWTADSYGEITWANQWWYTYTGAQELSRFLAESAVHPDDQSSALSEWSRSIETGASFRREIRFLRAQDHAYRWHVVEAHPLKDEQAQVIRWVGSCVDVHDQVNLVRDLEQERVLREHFVAALTHDLRTPLSAAKMSSQLLSRKMPESDASRKLAIRITNNLDRADEMIRDLLDAGQIKAGGAVAVENDVAVSLDQIVHDAMEDLISVHGERFKVGELPAVQGYWDRSVVRRIIENLVGNAVKYGSPSESITLDGAEQGDQVKISVHNFGDPIPAEIQKQLFEPYARSLSAIKSSQKGWGIGLTLVRGFAEAHGGHVEVVSSREQGTTFTVFLAKNSHRS